MREKARTTVFALGLVTCGLVTACADGPTGPAPTVVELSPADGASGVTLHTAVTVVFSEPVTGAAAADILTLERDGMVVDGGVTVDGSTVTFRPARALDPGRQYTAALSNANAGAGAVPPSRDTTWSFGTVGLPVPDVDTAGIMAHIRVLADDSMAGRGSGTEDERRAASYIQDRFQVSGLEPAPGGWLQSFDIPESNPDSPVNATSQNVMGVLPGAGPLADEWVIVGAHYDHEGTERVSPDSVIIYNGADDNASGTAVVLALAETLADYLAAGGTGNEPRRSIMFQAYGAEEVGLQGSTYYVDHPAAPMDSLAGMINLDMVGRLQDGDVWVAGYWTSGEWRPVTSRYNATGLTLIDYQDCQSCSDYAPFRRAGRPAVWFFTGFHEQYGTPEDDAELINVAGVGQIADLVAGAIVHLAVRADLLPFDRETPGG